MMPIRKQHVVSRTVLKRWTVDGHLTEFDVVYGGAKPKSPAATAWVEWFVHQDYSVAIEDVWKRVEDRFPTLVKHVEAGTAFSSNETLDGLRELVAVHAIRSKQLAEMWRQLFDWQQTSGRLADINALLDTPEANRLLAEHKTGLTLPADLPDSFGSGPYRDKVNSDAAPGGPWFIEQALKSHQQLCELLSTKFVQIGRCNTDLLAIGDNPATTYNKAKNVAGLLSGATFNDSTIVMPLTPRYVVSFATDTGGYIDLTENAIGLLNEIQLKTAERHVYAKPGTPSAVDLVDSVEAEAERRRSQGAGRSTFGKP